MNKKIILISALLTSIALVGCSGQVSEAETIAQTTCKLAKEYSKDRDKWKQVATSGVKKELLGIGGADFLGALGGSDLVKQALEKVDCTVISVEELDNETYKVNFENFFSMFVKEKKGELKVYKTGNGFNPF